jgi:hypothetical protein
MVLSIGIFFSLMIVGLVATLPSAIRAGLVAQGVPVPVARQVAATPVVSSLFAAFLGYNPMATLIPKQTLAGLPAHDRAVITGTDFFPHLISGPFMDGLGIAFAFACVLFLLAAIASWLRGAKYIYEDTPLT